MKHWNHRWLAGLMAVAALFALVWLGLARGGPLARAQSLTQVDQFGGAALAVTVAGERVYLADDADGVHVYERAGDGLVESQWLDWPGHIRDLAFTSRGAWVALPGQGVVETAADLPPTFQARFRYDGVLRVQGLAVNGSQLLVTESLPHGDPLLWGRRFPSRIHVLDISRPGQVVSQGEAATPGEALDLTVSRGFIFLAAGDAGLLVYAPE